eukprot:576600-Hanusia_phi.AAC.1
MPSLPYSQHAMLASHISHSLLLLPVADPTSALPSQTVLNYVTVTGKRRAQRLGNPRHREPALTRPT